MIISVRAVIGPDNGQRVFYHWMVPAYNSRGTDIGWVTLDDVVWRIPRGV